MRGEPYRGTSRIAEWAAQQAAEVERERARIEKERSERFDREQAGQESRRR